MGGMFFWAKASYTSFRPNASHISRWVYIQCCKMLHAKERLQQTQKPSFFLCQLTLTYKKQASTNFFSRWQPWYNGFPAPLQELKWNMYCLAHWSCLQKQTQKHLFSPGFYAFSTGFLRVWKPEVFFLETRCFTDQDSISTLYNGFFYRF